MAPRLDAAAAVEPERWTEALQLVTHLCAANSAAISVQHVSLGIGTRITVGYDTGRQPDYFEGFAEINPLFKSLLRQQIGVPHPHQTLVDDALFRRGAYFNEYCRPNGLHFMAGLIISRVEDSVEWLTVNRGQHRRAYDRRQLTVLGRLAPHFRRASEISRRLGEARVSRAAWESAIDALEHAMLLLDRRGRVVFANQAARQLDGTHDGFVLRGEGVSTPGAGDRLVPLIAAAANGDSHGVRSGGHLALPRRLAQQPLSAVLVPLLPEPAWQVPGAPAVLMVIADPTHAAAPDAALLAATFGLTEREAELATLLAAGQTLDAAAGRLGIGRETARTHLARALAKTGSGRQIDLVRLALAATPQVGGPRTQETSARR